MEVLDRLNALNSTIGDLIFMEEAASDALVFESAYTLEQAGFELPDTFTVSELIEAFSEIEAHPNLTEDWKGLIQGAKKKLSALVHPSKTYHAAQARSHFQKANAIAANPKAAFDKSAHSDWRTHTNKAYAHWTKADPKNSAERSKELSDIGATPGSEKERKQKFRSLNPRLSKLSHMRHAARREAILKGKAEPFGSSELAKASTKKTVQVDPEVVKKSISKKQAPKQTKNVRIARRMTAS